MKINLNGCFSLVFCIKQQMKGSKLNAIREISNSTNLK